jgi:hypothetical protein
MGKREQGSPFPISLSHFYTFPLLPSFFPAFKKSYAFFQPLKKAMSLKKSYEP